MRSPLKLSAGLLAALLLATPPAGAAKDKKASAPKADAQAEALLVEGAAQLERGEHTAAVMTLNKAARRQGSVKAYFLLGWAHYQRGFQGGSVASADKDDAQSALDAYGLALDLDPELSGVADPSRLHFSRALCYEAAGMNEKALDAYKAAFRAAPTKALIPLHAARLRLKMGEAAKALENSRLAARKARAAGQAAELLAAARTNPDFRALLASAPHRRALGAEDGLEDEALVASAAEAGEELRDAVRDEPSRAPAAQDPEVLDLVSRADLDFKFRRYAEAAAGYERALALDGERSTLSPAQAARAWERAGASRLKLGQAEEAAEALRRSLKADPMSPSAHYEAALAYAVAGKPSAALNELRETFASSSTRADLRRYLILAKTDSELEGVRELAGYRTTVDEYSGRVARE